MGILIKNSQNIYRLSQKRIERRALRALNALGCPEGELSILIVDDSRIEELNKKYLNRCGPTNVIAFPMREGNFSEISPDLLGDVVISAETAKKEGDAAGISMEERVDQLLVHGILHLFGYDHEKSEKEALIMENKSKEILK